MKVYFSIVISFVYSEKNKIFTADLFSLVANFALKIGIYFCTLRSFCALRSFCVNLRENLSQ